MRALILGNSHHTETNANNVDEESGCYFREKVLQPLITFRYKRRETNFGAGPYLPINCCTRILP